MPNVGHTFDFGRLQRPRGRRAAGVGPARRRGGRQAAAAAAAQQPAARGARAARAARRGDKKAASRIAKEAGKLESSKPFLRIAKLLASLPSLTANAVVQGVLTEGAPEALDGLLRSAADAAEDRRQELIGGDSLLDAVFGKVSRVDGSFVELVDSQGGTTRVAKSLAEAAHRDQPGDCLAIFSDQLGAAQLIVSARPALETTGALMRRAFSPFERTTTPLTLTAQDIALLSRPPKPLRIPFPVAIER